MEGGEDLHISSGERESKRRDFFFSYKLIARKGEMCVSFMRVTRDKLTKNLTVEPPPPLSLSVSVQTERMDTTFTLPTTADYVNDLNKIATLDIDTPQPHPIQQTDALTAPIIHHNKP